VSLSALLCVPLWFKVFFTTKVTKGNTKYHKGFIILKADRIVLQNMIPNILVILRHSIFSNINLLYNERRTFEREKGYHFWCIK